MSRTMRTWIGGTMLLCASALVAQEGRRGPEQTVASERTFFLKYARTQQDQNELLTALRNLLEPSSKIFLVPGQSAILMEASPEQFALAEKLLRDIDLPRKLYRLTYTVTETEGEKRVGVQHFAMLVAAGQRTQMKQGNRVPLVTGSLPVAGTASASTQVSYIDVGVNVDATVDALENAVGLRTKVELSSVTGELSSTLSQDPVIRQTTLEGTSVVTLGKPLELESLDVPGSTRHTRVEVVAELVK